MVKSFLKYLSVAIMITLVCAFLLDITARSQNARYMLFSGYYPQQTKGFLKGQLNLPLEPEAGLLALPDPYDPVANWPYREHDLVLYNRHYYIYWGPFPALVLMPLMAIFKTWKASDFHIAYFFTVAMLLFFRFIVYEIRRAIVPQAPEWTELIGILLLSLGTPLLFTLKRPSVYEASIITAQAMMLGGIYLILRMKHSQITVWLALLSSLCFGAAICSRLTILPACMWALFMGLWLFWASDHPQAGRLSMKQRFTVTLCLILPFILSLIGYGWFNWARFGSPFESGQRYQLSTDNVKKTYDSIISVAYMPANIYNYLIRPLTFQAAPPYVLSIWEKHQFPAFIHIPETFRNNESIAGIWTSTPLTLLALLPITHQLLAWRKPEVRQWRWYVWCLTGMTMACLMPLLIFAGGTMRYILDFLPTMLVLTTIAIWILQQWLTRHMRWQKPLYMLGSILLMYSLIVGILLSQTGYLDVRNHPQSHIVTVRRF